jgi:LysR family transcriptional regulator, glycine cleavage system transcriptional activator
MAKLPPLNALRAFESAGRHLSFTKAGDELAVTPTAISHQIRLLEDTLGVKLFRRLPRQLLLTDAGQMLLADAKDAFARLALAVDRVTAGGHSGPLTVSSTQTFAWSWLVPRLYRFQVKYPEIDLRLEASQRAVDFHREGVDVAIRYGRGGWEGIYAVRLFSEVLTPLLSRELLEKGPPLNEPSDILKYPLLRDSPFITEDWKSWFAAAGVTEFEHRSGGAFDSSQMAVQAALSGAGVALVMADFFKDEVKSGRLVRPFALEIDSGKSHYFVCPEPNAQQPKIVAFRDWLVEELCTDPLRDERPKVPEEEDEKKPARAKKVSR